MEHIRNFCIIAHIDHGKSTLADRFLELTKTIADSKMQEQFLDRMPLEREKGITIKMQPVRMEYAHEGKPYLLNLIDTPGHVDFSYEVSRGLAAVEGAILLVDATKGIQAQTLHHLAEAQKQNLVIVPAVNKIDMPQAQIEETKQEIRELLQDADIEISEISAKDGTGVEALLQRVIRTVPQPTGDTQGDLRALIFDSQYDAYKGVIAFVRVVDGNLKPNIKVQLVRKKAQGMAKDIGYFLPDLKMADELKTGEVGYIATGLKDTSEVRVGDTIALSATAEALAGYQEPNPVVFMSFYPQDPNELAKFQKALNQLQLTDPAFAFEPEKKTALGQGFRCSFLGNLHAEIIIERLRREFDVELVVSRPQVVYSLMEGDRERFIFSAQDFPENTQHLTVKERWVSLEIVVPTMYLGGVMQLLDQVEGAHKETTPLGEGRLIIGYEMPLRELMTRNFYDQLKGASSGFASLNYELTDWRSADLVKMEILIAGNPEELFSQIVRRGTEHAEGKKVVKKLKDVLPRQQFAVALQAKVGGNIVARETISAARKDVTGYLYGGDYSRKRKLLEKQKKGKKKLKEAGRVTVPSDVFLKMIRE